MSRAGEGELSIPGGAGAGGTRPLNEAIIAKTGASLEIIPEKVPENIASSCLVAPS